MSSIPVEREKKLRKLAEMMNTRHRMPFPINKPLLDCFDIAIAPEELDFLLAVGTEPLSRSKAATLSGLPEDQFEIFFDRLLKKGLIWPQIGTDGVYRLPGIMLGWFETFLSDGRETPDKSEFARRLDRLFRSLGKMNVFPLRNLINKKAASLKPQRDIAAIRPLDAPATRTISVNQTIPAGPVKIFPAQTVNELIENNADDIAVIHCFCRQYHKLIGEPCRFEHPPESCIVIGKFSRHMVNHGGGRKLSKDEALSLIHELQQKGAVHQVFHEKEDLGQPEIAICNCCWDCCGVLGSYNRAIIPLHLKSYFEARIPDPSLCNGCAVCENYCPVQAVSIENGKSEISGRKCIGCGQCELHCSEHAITLHPNERFVMLPLQKRSEARIPWS